MRKKELALNVVVAALAVVVLTTASPAFAQVVGTVDPGTMVGNVVRAALLAFAAVTAGAGVYKGIQVYSGHRDFYQAATYLLGGFALGGGTAAVVGFT